MDDVIVLVDTVVARVVGATAGAEAFHAVHPAVWVLVSRLEVEDVVPPHTTDAVALVVLAAVLCVVLCATVTVIALAVVVSVAAAVAAEVSRLGAALCRAVVLQVGVARLGQEADAVTRIRATHAAGALCVEDAVCPGLRAGAGAKAGAEAGELVRAASVEIIDERKDASPCSTLQRLLINQLHSSFLVDAEKFVALPALRLLSESISLFKTLMSVVFNK